MKINIKDEYGNTIATVEGEVPRVGENIFIQLNTDIEIPTRKVTEVSRIYAYVGITRQYEEVEVNVYVDNLGT